jgi:SAM-dependent methyltransferase
VTDPTDAPERSVVTRAHWFEDLADHMGPTYLRYAFTRGTAQEVGFIAGELEARLGPLAGLRIVDLGCGPGRHALAFASLGAEVVGVDIARRFLEVAATTPVDGPGQTCWVRSDARHLPLASESCDVVVSLCQGAFGVPPLGAGDRSDAEIVSEVARILRRGGLVALSAFSAYFQVRFLEESDTFDAGLGLNHERTVVHDPEGRPLPAELWTSCYTPRELRLLLGNAGLDVEALWSVTPGSYEPNPPDLDHPEFLVLARRR